MKFVNFKLAGLVCLVCLTLFAGVAPAQVAESDPRFSEASLGENNRRAEQIKLEIAELKNHPWAGEYYYGDGLGVNVRIAIAPKSGFVFTWSGCLGIYDQNYGSVAERDGKIILTFNFPNSRVGFQGLDREFYPVVWGERHYLIAADRIADFANFYNRYPRERKKPGERLVNFGERFLVRTDDRQKNYFGRPNLPAEFQKYLLERPIRARVVSIRETVVETDEADAEISRRITRLTLDVGRASGVFEKMEFHPASPAGVYESAVVTRVFDTTAEAEIVETIYNKSKMPVAPSLSWTFSTSSNDKD